MAELSSRWETDWTDPESEANSHILNWQGFPGDLAWSLQHQFGFLGSPKLIAFYHNDVLLQAGGLYLIFGEGNQCQDILTSFDPGVPLSTIDPWGWEPGPTSQRCTTLSLRLSPVLQRREYRGNVRFERRSLKRNRWQEQHERGGRPPAQLF